MWEAEPLNLVRLRYPAADAVEVVAVQVQLRWVAFSTLSQQEAEEVRAPMMVGMVDGQPAQPLQGQIPILVHL